MPVTNYDSAGGMLIGQRAVGFGALVYLPDPSGSVTGVVQDGKICTASFTPYGTGTHAAGSTFGWNGAWGYRPTGKSEASHYVRARSYSNARGRWTSQDPLWSNESAYGYVGGEPVQRVDPSGLVPMSVRASAFIPKRLNDHFLGPWFAEPPFGWSGYYFEGDNRAHGDAGSSRLSIRVNSDSCGIGSPLWASASCDDSVRGVRASTGLIVPVARKRSKAHLEQKESHARRPGFCVSTVRAVATAEYPFLPGVSPDIKIVLYVSFRVVAKNFVEIQICIAHTYFPDFEVITWASGKGRRIKYAYTTPWSGPNPVSLGGSTSFSCESTVYNVPTDPYCSDPLACDRGDCE